MTKSSLELADFCFIGFLEDMLDSSFSLYIYRFHLVSIRTILNLAAGIHHGRQGTQGGCLASQDAGAKRADRHTSLLCQCNLLCGKAAFRTGHE